MSQPLALTVCGPGGTSAIRPGYDPTQILLGDAIGDALTLLGMPELAVVFASVGVLQFALNAVCSQDPPALPTIDAARLQQYYDTASSQAYPLILQDAQAVVGHYLWYQWCECVTGPQPTPPSALPFPPGVSLDKQPVGSDQTGTCFTPVQTQQSGVTDSNGYIAWSTAGSILQIGPATTYFNVRQNNSDAVTHGPFPVTNFFDQVDASSNILETSSWTYLTEPTLEAQMHHSGIPRTPGATAVRFRSQYPGGTHTVSSGWLGNQYCTQLPPSLRPDCCPPDPELENLIVQVLRLERLILDSLGGSHAYSRGTAHTGIQGTTSLPVAGLRGIAVDVTAGTPTTPLLPGNPPYQFDLGWLSVSNGDGMLQEQRLTRQHLVWLPPSMDLATSVGLYLFPGVTITLTELVPA